MIIRTLWVIGIFGEKGGVGNPRQNILYVSAHGSRPYCGSQHEPPDVTVDTLFPPAYTYPRHGPEDTTMMRRTIGVFVTLALGLLVALLAAEAQSVAKTPRIGILNPAFDPHPPLEAFRQGLHDLGYVEGHNMVLEYRFADGRFERLPELAAELVRLKVDVILAVGVPAIRAAQHTTGTIPIVFPVASDPVGQGLVASLAQPGANTTGLSFQDPEFMGKRLELLRQVVPGVTRVAYLWDAALPNARAWQETETAARALGVQLLPVEVREPYPFDQAFATMAEAHADALITLPSTVFMNRRTQIVDLASKTRLPGIFPDRELADAGGLMSYGPSLTASYHRAAIYVDKILKGAKPADLPVERPTTFELVINLKTAQALRLTVPPSILFQATEVIR
jgi:putative tryptophan/tyrosine transport system substrate-binding protein